MIESDVVKSSVEKLDSMIRSENRWHEAIIQAELSHYEAALRNEKRRHDNKIQELEMILSTIKNDSKEHHV